MPIEFAEIGKALKGFGKALTGHGTTTPTPRVKLEDQNGRDIQAFRADHLPAQDELGTFKSSLPPKTKPGDGFTRSSTSTHGEAHRPDFGEAPPPYREKPPSEKEASIDAQLKHDAPPLYSRHDPRNGTSSSVRSSFNRAKEWSQKRYQEASSWVEKSRANLAKEARELKNRVTRKNEQNAAEQAKNATKDLPDWAQKLSPSMQNTYRKLPSSVKEQLSKFNNWWGRQHFFTSGKTPDTVAGNSEKSATS